MPRTPRRRPRSDGADADKPRLRGWQRPLGWLRRAGQFFFALSFSSLTRRIVSLNLAGLIALVASILYLSQFRAGLIDARAKTCCRPARSIARAIAATGTTETNALTIDPDRLLDLKPGESYGPSGRSLRGSISRSIPSASRRCCARLISPTKTRARIYDRDGGLILDSRSLSGRGDVMRFELAPPTAGKPGIAERTIDRGPHLAQSRRSAALSRTRARERQGLQEVAQRAQRRQGLHGADQRSRRSHRLGRGPGAALPRGQRRADAVDPGRRHRPDGDRRAARDPESRRRRLRGHDRAVAAAGEHHRRPGAPARRQRRAGPPPYPHPRRNSRFHPPPRRDRPSLRRAARHDRRAL